MPLASTGSPGSIGGVHIDVITAIRAPRNFLRTEVAVERGQPVTAHRQRVSYPLELDVVISDCEPFAGASLTPLWEADHARKTRQRLLDLLEAGTVITVFDGAELWRTPAGSRVWIIDAIDDGKMPEDTPQPGEASTWRATIRIAEFRGFSTSFASADPNVDPSIADDVDGIVDTGTQSTTQVTP